MENKKILLADASEPVQKVIDKAFQEEDYELTIVNDYGSAIKMIAAEAPSLILVGASLPGKDGYSLCEFVKTNAPSIPVVMLIGTEETLKSEEAKRVGVDDYFIRPFKSQDLIEKIGELLTLSPMAVSVAPVPEPEENLLISNSDEPLGATGESELLESPDSPEQEDSAEDLLSEMGIPEAGLDEIDVVYTNEQKEEVTGIEAEEEAVQEDESIEDFLSDLDDDTDEVLEIVPETVPVDRAEGATENAGTDEISFNEDDIIEEHELVEPELAEPEDIDPLVVEPELAEPLKVDEAPAVEKNVDMKGAAVEGIVEISKSKIEELILNNTKEDIKEIAYELVPGLAREPIAAIVPEAVQRAAEKLVGEIATETTGKVAEVIIAEIVAEITSQKAAQHIAQIAGEAVMKAAEERMKEIASEVADKVARELISKIATDTAVKAAEEIITDEIKRFKSTLSKEG